jgi:hypothetical protein
VGKRTADSHYTRAIQPRWKRVATCGAELKRLLHTGDTTEVEKGGDARGRFENGHYTRAIQPRWKRVATCGAESKKVTTGRRYNRGKG